MTKKKAGFDLDRFMAWEPTEEQKSNMRAEFNRLMEKGAFALPDFDQYLPSPDPTQSQSQDAAKLERVMAEAQRLERYMDSEEFQSWFRTEYAAEDRAYREDMARLRARDDWQRAKAATVRGLIYQSSKVDRQASRWQACIDAGLTMPSDTFRPLPRGIGKIAEAMGITRQALTHDLNAHRERIFGK